LAIEKNRGTGFSLQPVFRSILRGWRMQRLLCCCLPPPSGGGIEAHPPNFQPASAGLLDQWLQPKCLKALIEKPG